MSKKLNFEDFLLAAKKVHGNKYKYFKDFYTNSHEKTKIICEKHGVFLQLPKNHVRRGQGCPLCGSIKKGLSRRLSQEDFLNRSREIHGNQYEYDTVIYKTARDFILIKCKKHGIFSQRAGGHLSRRGCPKCRYIKSSKSNSKSQEEILELFKETHGNKYDYSLVKYWKAKVKVKIICRKHGIFEQDPYDHYALGTGCPLCGESKGERTVEKFLSKNNFLYKRQKTFSKCKYKQVLPFDFYLPEFNTCIEFDGALHFYPNFGQEQLKNTQRNDEIKNKFCYENNIKLIRIKDIQKVSEVLKKSL